MKKGVLLTGVLAAGLAAAPVTAKADVASAPQIHDSVTEDPTVVSTKLLDLLQGLDYDLGAIKKQIYDKSDRFVGMEDEAQEEALNDIVNIATQIENSRKEFAALQTKHNDHTLSDAEFVEAVNAMIYNPVITREQAQKGLYERYTHLDQDWKKFRAFQKKGDALWKTFTTFCNAPLNKGVDEIKDVIDLHEKVNKASEAYRTAYLTNHENRTKTWNHSDAFHATEKCLVEAEGDVNALYEKFEAAEKAYEQHVQAYYDKQTVLVGKVNAEVAKWNTTASEDGNITVNAAKEAVENFVETFNAADVDDWKQFQDGEDQLTPAFENLAGYETRANELIKALQKAIDESNANEKAYQDGVAALNTLKNTLADIKTAYYDKAKENTTGYVYRDLIDGLEGAINDAKTALDGDYNDWTSTTGEGAPWLNAVEHVAGVTKDNVIYGQLKQDIADLLTKIQKNEAANDKIHQMTAALQGHYTELKNAVAGYEDVSLSQYAADGLCAHGEYLGTTNLDKLLDEFIKTEQEKYNAIQSDAYLADTTVDGPTAKKDALAHELEMTWNAIATDQCAKYLAKVEAEYNTKHAYCEGLDDVCNEVEGEGAPCNCSEDDREANPCGWCDATARGMHDAIETAKANMDGQIQDWHFATDAKNHVAEVKTYKDDAFTAIENWVKTFEEADRLHDKNLDDLKVIVDKAVHNVHEVYADAKHDLDNYKEGDLAAANLWAQDKYGVDFKGYVQLLEELYETAQVAADDARAKHHFTDLKAVGAECDQCTTDSDYRVAVQANNATNDANLVAIADLETLLNSVVISEADVYPSDYTALDGAYQAIVNEIDKARTDANAAYVAGKADEFILPTGISSAIITLQNDLKAAEKKLADNKAAKAELEGLFANLTADVTAAVIGDVYEADATILENERTQLLERINNEVKNVAGDFEKGEVCDNYENLKEGYAEFLKDVKGFVGRIKDAEKKLADNKAAAAAYIEQVNDLATVVRATVPGEVYEADLETLADAQTELLGKLFAENGVIDAALKAGTVLTDKATIEEAIAVLSIAVQEYQGKVKTAEKYLADSKAKAAAVSTAYNGLLDELKTLSYGDVYADEAAEIDKRIASLKAGLQNELTIVAEDFENREVLDKDYTEPINNFTADVKGLNDFIKDCEKRLADNKAAKAELDSQLAAFQATVNGIVLNSETLYEDDYDTLFGKLDALRALIGTVSGEIAAAFDGKVATEYQFPSTLATKLVELQGEKVTLENLYAANVAAREAKLREIADLEVALEAVVLDAKQVYNTENHSNLDQLLDMAADIQTKIDDARTGLYAAFDAKTAPDYNVPANEISTAIKELKLAVSDFQEFKRQNIEKATLLYNDLTNLLAEIEGLKKYGPVYEDEVEGGYDKTHIDRQIETLINSLKGALNWLKNDLESGDVVANLDSYGQDYDFALEEIENIKAGIEAAEQLYAANLRALNNLEEMIMAEKTVLENTKAMCACNECNTEDKAAVDALVGTLDTILGNVNDAFADTKNLWQLEGQFKGQVDDVKADAANLLALVQLHLDRVQSDLRAYNVLQKALEDVELWLANVELEDGWENFAERNAHCSNPDVKYLNELTTDVNDLKALIDQQHSHEGGHSCEEYKIDDMKAMKVLIEDAKTLIAAIQANNAAYALINDRYDELYNDALAAYKFWHQYYAEQTLNDDWYTANKGWIQEWDGELEAGDYLVMLKNYFDDLYNHGNAAYEWTVDAQGKELKDAATETFEKQDTDLAKDRNDLAHKEALNHWQTVKNTVDTAKFQVWDEYGLYDYWTDTTTWDPFAANVMKGFNEEFEGEFGMIASLNTFKADIEAAYAEGVMEDAINIDEHNTALGIHQQLNGVLGVLGMVMEEYADLFAESHHLTNGKKIYSDQEYFTLGFFEKANDGSVANGQEMFKEVKVLVNDDIRLYDSRAYVWNDMGTPDDWSDDEALVDEKGRVVYDKENNPGEIAEVNVLTVGQKSNELSFKFHQNPMALERATLKAGTAEVDFLPGSISVKGDNMAEAWVLKHTVSIDGIDVLAPEVADMEITPYATSGKLIVRVDNPIDLTYTINSLIARTDTGVEFSYADRELNYAAGQIEFTLPEGTQSVELPEGFFTFRTGENSIARSAACVVAVNNKTTSIDELVAMGEKAQIFDLQGRRVKAEALISGNTYVVNGEKKMVK